MLENIDSILSICVSILTLLGFLYMIFRRGTKTPSQSSVPHITPEPPVKKKKRGFSLSFFVILGLIVGFSVVGLVAFKALDRNRPGYNGAGFDRDWKRRDRPDRRFRRERRDNRQ